MAEKGVALGGRVPNWRLLNATATTATETATVGSAIRFRLRVFQCKVSFIFCTFLTPHSLFTGYLIYFKYFSFLCFSFLFFLAAYIFEIVGCFFFCAPPQSGEPDASVRLRVQKPNENRLVALRQTPAAAAAETEQWRQQQQWQRRLEYSRANKSSPAPADVTRFFLLLPPSHSPPSV